MQLTAMQYKKSQIGDNVFVQPPNGTAVTTSAIVDIASVMLPTAHAIHTLRGGSCRLQTFLAGNTRLSVCNVLLPAYRHCSHDCTCHQTS